MTRESSEVDSIAGPSTIEDHSNDVSPYCKQPRKDILNINFDGFELKVADDSGRHFAGTQDLIILSLGKLFISREALHHNVSSVKVRLHTLDLFDCLQDATSPFRTAASSRSGAMGLHHNNSIPQDTNAHEDRVKTTWEEHCLRRDGEWDFLTSPALIKRAQQAASDLMFNSTENEISSSTELIELLCMFSGNKSRDYSIRMRSFAVQWNPSTVIAIQRFLGRLRKESKVKATKVHNQDDRGVGNTSSAAPSQDSVKETNVNGEMTTRLTVNADSLTICLNKEHQNRRLLELTLSSCSAKVVSSIQGLCVDGQLGDLHAWDSDNYNRKDYGRDTITNANRNLFKVLSVKGIQDQSSRSAFLKVHYKTFKERLPQSMLDKEVPKWVESHIADTGDIDDFLRVSVAAIEFVYFKERTAEILDYLSNGLPGKGMGATSRAAKGFISKRILTKSFLEVCVDSPQVIVPQHESLGGGITLTLGT